MIRELLENSGVGASSQFKSKFINQDPSLEAVGLMCRLRIDEKSATMNSTRKPRAVRKWPKIAEVLRPQMIDGNSKLAFLFGASNSMAPEHMHQFVDMASDTSKVFQSAVQANTVPLGISELHKLKQEIIGK